MKMQLQNIRLQLRQFMLEIDAELNEPVTGIFGPSGSGKTSLLDLIAGLRKPQTGAAILNGDLLFDHGKHVFVPPRHRRIGYVPQDLALFPHLNVRANLAYGLSSGEARDELFSLSHVAEIMEIQHLFGSPVTQLSGGEQQRVAFARAILSQPRLMLLDEPMSSLDSRLKQRLIPFLLRIRDEFRIPVLYVTHDAAELSALCDEVLLIENGRIVRRGDPTIIDK
jgi:molybdate transport system ATP-binding protein